MGNVVDNVRRDFAAFTEFGENLASKADSIGEIDYKLERLPLHQVLLISILKAHNSPVVPAFLKSKRTMRLQPLWRISEPKPRRY